MSRAVTDALANQPIVIDNGSGVCKAGFAGGSVPKVVFRSLVGTTKHTRMMPGGALEGTDFFIGPKAEEHRGALSLNYPIEHGIVQNWADMERVWRYVYNKDNLNVSSDEHAVLLTEAPLNPYKNREKSAEIFFEGFNVPAMFCAMQAILSLYASGRTTGVVLDSGDGVTHSVPVYEGFALNHCIQRVDVAGRDVTSYLQLLLRRAGYTFVSTAEEEVVRQIKEKLCEVSPTAQPKEGMLAAKTQIYQLPDGSNIEVSGETLKAPEVLFQPDILGIEHRGIHDCLVKSIMKADLDLRKTLFSEIVLSGGSTLFPGFGDRLLSEVRRHTLSPKDAKIRIAAPPERIYSTWVGGSILGSLSTFRSMWISKADYLEHGARLLNN